MSRWPRLADTVAREAHDDEVGRARWAAMRVLVAAAGAAVAVAGVALMTAAAASAAPRADTDAGSASVGDAPGSWNVHAAGVATPLVVTAAGQTVTFAYTLTNASAAPVSDPSVTGTLNGSVVTVACPAGVLAPGAGVTCTGTYPVRAADLDSASLTLEAAIGATSSDGRPLGAAAVPATVVVAHAGSVRAVAAPLATPADTATSADPATPADPVTREAQAAPAGAAQRRLGAAPSVSPSGSATTWSSGPVAYTGPPDTGVTVAAGLALLVIGGLLLTLARPRAAGARVGTRTLRRSRAGHHAGSTVAQWRR